MKSGWKAWRVGIAVAGGLVVASVLAAQHPPLQTYYYYDSGGTCPAICTMNMPMCGCLCPTCGPR